MKSPQRQYLFAHPLAIWFSIGVTITGMVALAFPHLADQSAVSLALPDWLEKIFNILLTIGGFMSTLGIVSGKPKYEAAGMALLSGAFLSFFSSIIYLRVNNVASAVFLFTLAVGCAQRSIHLARRGYKW